MNNTTILSLLESNTKHITAAIERRMAKLRPVKTLRSGAISLDQLNFARQISDLLDGSIEYLAKQLLEVKAHNIVRCYIEHFDEASSIDGGVIYLCVDYTE